MITATDLRLSLGKRFVLEAASLRLDKPLVFLTGANGSGKSTLLYLLAGLHRPDRGRLEMDGRPVPTARAQVAVALADTYYPSGWSYAGAARYEQALRPGDALAAIRAQLYEAFGTAAYADKRLADLSAGMHQKANLLLALHGAPRYLLLDEPEAHLDADSLQALIQAVGQLIGAGVQVVCATHLTQLWDALIAQVDSQTITFPLS